MPRYRKKAVDRYAELVGLDNVELQGNHCRLRIDIACGRDEIAQTYWLFLVFDGLHGVLHYHVIVFVRSRIRYRDIDGLIRREV